MDMNARLDGFLVHPLDLFAKNQKQEFDETTANLDGFKVHPLDSFINHNKNDKYKYLGNNTTTNYDYSNLMNKINISPINTNNKSNLYDQYLGIKSEPYSYDKNYTSSNNFVNTGNFGNNNTYNKAYNYVDNTNNLISYYKYPAINLKNYTEKNNHNYDYLQKNSYNNNKLSKYPKYKITDFTGNYAKTYETFPNDTSTNSKSYEILPSTKIINKGITYDKYTATTNASDISYGKPSFDILNSPSSTNPYSYKPLLNYSKPNNYTYNVLPTSTLTNIKTVETLPNGVYTISSNPKYSKRFFGNSFPKKTMTKYKNLSSFKSTDNIFKNKLYGSFINPTISPVYRGTSFPLRSYTVPKEIKSKRTTAILPSKTKIIAPTPTNNIDSKIKIIYIPKSNHRIVERARTPILSNTIITSPNKMNNISTPTKNAVTIPTIIAQTAKPLKSVPQYNQIKILPPRTISLNGSKVKNFINFGKIYYKPKDFGNKKNKYIT